MPSKTYYNLKEEKRQRILDAAIAEIAEHGFFNASVNRIVKASGIATGSFYQYFEDIEDLFYVVGIEVTKMKAAYMQKEFDGLYDKSIDSLVGAMYRGGIRFAFENELTYKLWDRLYEVKNAEFIKKIMKTAPKTAVYSWLAPLIKNAIDNGEMYPGITMELFFSLIVNVNMTILDYMISMNENGKFEITTENMDKLADLGVHLLLHGIKKK